MIRLATRGARPTVAGRRMFSMPPYELWLRGRPDIERWCRGPGEGCPDSRTLPTRANGLPPVAVTA